MSSRDDRRDDDLEERLDELEDVLTELRRDLRETERDRRGPPRPPRLSELLRFTERYTIPTLIALLETTIKSLELLQGTLRLADPNRSVVDDAGTTADRLADVRDGASAGLARSLSELRSALSEADLPEEAASRSIIEDARDLTAEIESRIEDGRREADAARRSGERREKRGRDKQSDEAQRDDEGNESTNEGGVRIDVTDPEDSRDAENADESSDELDDPEPEVDVESELESIKRQLGDDEESTADEDPDDDTSQATNEIADGDGADGDIADGDGDDSNGDADENAYRDDRDAN